MAESRLKLTMYVNQDILDIIKAKQFDALSRYLDITLVNDDGTPYDLTGHTARFNAKKRDGTYVFNDAAITNPAAGLVTVELTDQTLAVGDQNIYADISLFSSNNTKILTTRTFAIFVQTTVRNDAAIMSSNEYGSVINLFQDVADMRQTITDMAAKFGEFDDELTAGQQAATGKSVFGALNKIWDYLQRNSSAGIVATVNNIYNLLNGAIKTNVSSILNLVTNSNVVKYGSVKNVQRGVATDVAGSEYITVTIGSVNPAKCLVIVDGFVMTADTNDFMPMIVQSLTATTLTLQISSIYVAHNTRRDNVSWQVVEYY